MDNATRDPQDAGSTAEATWTMGLRPKCRRSHGRCARKRKCRDAMDGNERLAGAGLLEAASHINKSGSITLFDNWHKKC